VTIKRFESHLHDPSPGFRCFAAGDKSESLAHLARVKHKLGRPATSKTLALIQKRLGKSLSGLRRFYERHDGVLLYQDSRSDAAGVEFFKVAEWNSRTEEMRASMLAMGFEGASMPAWFDHGLVFEKSLSRQITSSFKRTERMRVRFSMRTTTHLIQRPSQHRLRILFNSSLMIHLVFFICADVTLGIRMGNQISSGFRKNTFPTRVMRSFHLSV
jgi:hypothetical protein